MAYYLNFLLKGMEAHQVDTADLLFNHDVLKCTDDVLMMY